MTSHSRRSPAALHRAFDEASFGAERTLNLRESQPTVPEATRRAEAWLRERQVAGPHDALIITGRGNQSEGGVSPVREAVLLLLFSLRRRGVLTGHREHTPGSFVATLAPMRSLVDAPRRNRGRGAPRVAPAPPALASLEPETLTLLRELAQFALHGIGVKESDGFVRAEMLRQFSAIAGAVPGGADREARLRIVIRAMLDDHY